MPTLVVYGNVADNTVKNVSASYTFARDGGGGAVTQTLGTATSITMVIGQENSVGSEGITQGFFAFDTSGFSGVSVISATFQEWTSAVAATNGDTYEIRPFDWGTAVAVTDWVPGATYAALPLLASLASTALIPSVPQIWNSNGSELADAINLSGFTRVVMCTSMFAAGTDQRPDTMTATFGAADQAGTGSDPRLNIKYGVTSSDNLLNPAFDISSAGWTTNTGSVSNLWDAINEDTAVDTDFVQSSGVADGLAYEVGLEGQLDPASSIGHVIHIRYERDNTNNEMHLRVDLVQNTTIIATRWYYNIGTTEVTDDYTLTNAEADAITDYYDLRLRFTPYFI